MTDLRPGEVVAGYVIEQRIGAGGSGTVYAARHPRLPRLAALKVFSRDDVDTDAEQFHRFQREADITARFDHPNIVSVYDRGVDGGRLWIAMQYVPGTDAETEWGTTPERAFRIAADIASALDYAHGKGVLHRDVKPSNILLSPAEDGRVERALLTDFGIARLRDESTHLTRTGNVAATFAFASPEQLAGQPLDPRTDQYSLACTLFVLLTGVRPFRATDMVSWMYAHTQLAPLHVSEVRPDLPAALDPVFDQALAKDPNQRFGGCVDFVDAAWSAWATFGVPTVTDPQRRPPGPAATTNRYPSDPSAPQGGVPQRSPTWGADPPAGVRDRSPSNPQGHWPWGVDAAAAGGAADRSPAGGASYPRDWETMLAPERGTHRAGGGGGNGIGGRVLVGAIAGLVAALVVGLALWGVVTVESGSRAHNTPLSASVPTAGLAPTVTPATTTVTPVAAGQVPAALIGNWAGTSNINTDGYQLTIRQGAVNQVVMTSIVTNYGNVLCAFDYQLLNSDADSITVGNGVVTTGGSSCTPQNPETVTLSGAQLIRDLSVSGRVVYNRGS
ncbi:serine/threonine-protein kinase [Nocardia sp. NPDC088792]|uniref:serine/threonine-protein kinase n=1 Tax=Nocardia sp. NPDC088792 TaxID=3364332 RepID=UPI0038166334